MTKVYLINCRDAGVECDFESRGSTVEEVIERCAEHAGGEHGMKAFGPELYAKMRGCIRTIEEEASSPA